jgi:hypothetical protein
VSRVLTLAALVGVICVGCGTPPPQSPHGIDGDFSLVVGAPIEWASRIDQGGYLDGAECQRLCPATFASRHGPVELCHLARVVGQAKEDTAAVVCNGATAPREGAR